MSKRIEIGAFFRAELHPEELATGRFWIAIPGKPLLGRPFSWPFEYHNDLFVNRYWSADPFAIIRYQEGNDSSRMENMIGPVMERLYGGRACSRSAGCKSVSACQRGAVQAASSDSLLSWPLWKKRALK